MNARVLKYYDIVDVIGESVTLQKVGNRMYLGFCPFATHRMPSFHVSQEEQLFFCTECDARGDLVDYLSRFENISGDEVIRLLGNKANLPLEPDSDDFRRRQEMFRAHDLATKYYHHILMNTEAGEPARRYLESRGITHETMIHFQIGYAPDSWNVLRNFLLKRGFADEFLREAGLLAESTSHPGRHFDLFRDRVMFPIQDEYGHVVGFGGRAIGEIKPKYLNTPETPIFLKRRNLFNVHRAVSLGKQENVLLLEGYMDVIMACQNGIHNVVAALGTALTVDHVRLLQNNTDEIVLVFDGDQAGQKATLRSADVLKAADMRAKVAAVPDGLDPDEFLRTHGRDEFIRKVLGYSHSIITFQMIALRENHDLSTSEGKERYFREVCETVLVDVTDEAELDTHIKFLKVLKNQ